MLCVTGMDLAPSEDRRSFSSAAHFIFIVNFSVKIKVWVKQ